MLAFLIGNIPEHKGHFSVLKNMIVVCPLELMIGHLMDTYGGFSERRVLIATPEHISLQV